MTKSEMSKLLALIAAYDQRTVGETDVEAWWAVAQVEDWQLVHVRRAVIEFHRAGAGRGRIRPADVGDILRDVRRKISRVVVDEIPDPPRELADDPTGEIAWRRREIDRRVSAAMDGWATGRPLPQPVAEIPTPRNPMPDRVRRLIGGACAMPREDRR